MFENVLMTTVTPLSNVNEINCWENRPFINAWPSKRQQHKLNGSTVTMVIKKKKRNRTSFSSQQLKLLEKTYNNWKYVDRERRQELSSVLGIADKCIKVWFQNRRMKEKRESSDSSNTSLKSYTDSVSPSSQTDSEDIHKDVDNHTNFNMNYTMTYYEHPNNFTQNHYSADEIQINQPYYNSSVQSSFCNDTNIYPIQYYPYNYNEINYGEQHNNNYSGYSSESQTWTEETFDLSYL